MSRLLTIIALCAFGAAVAWLVPVDHVFATLQPLMVSLSIVTAAVLVRLNRGMPTLDWKALKVEERKRITASVLYVTKEYLIIAAIFAFTILVFLFFSIAGKEEISKNLFLSRIASGAIGFLSALCLSRMSYVAWRDYDIVKLQKTIIDLSGERDALEEAKKLGEEKLAVIRGSGLKSPAAEPPKAWLG